MRKRTHRPVTVLPTVDKVFENLLSNQLKSLSDKVLDNSNSAYRKSYSCEITLICLVEDWKLALDNCLKVGVLSTDMSKAFDMVYPPLLLSKMQSYGVSGSSLDLLNEYFSERENRVRLGNCTSNWKLLHRGCPQGSSLDPIMRNFYQNDLFYESISSKLSAYADDHQLHTKQTEKRTAWHGLLHAT